jgi:2-keto-4-pentenoate hydratase/2-oxohepta-3-ene-1,7-dioic acid hydratase in catechol pathway
VNGTVVSRPSVAALYWSYAQMLAHLTSNGAAWLPDGDEVLITASAGAITLGEVSDRIVP